MNTMTEHPKLTEQVTIPAGPVSLAGELVVPPKATGIVLFIHGSGSSRHSPRNRFVAAQLQQCGLATLLMDMLTPQEEAIDIQTAEKRFDIELLCDRVLHATAWVQGQRELHGLPVGYFGASTGAAAALMAAGECPDAVAAVVSRGGRPDLATDQALRDVRSPTLLIVGGLDTQVMDLNRHALAMLQCTRQLKIIPGAGHLFEEPGALEKVADLASAWFQRHLRR